VLFCIELIEVTMTHFHAVAWIDHSEAHVFQLNEETAERTLVHASAKHRHIHHRSGTLGSGKAPEDVAYLDSVAQALEGASEILVMGPANEKHVLKKHLDAHHAAIGAKVIAVENADHPSDGEILAYARKFFVAADRMHLRK
jgi:hypothetical protein